MKKGEKMNLGEFKLQINNDTEYGEDYLWDNNRLITIYWLHHKDFTKVI